MPANGQHGRSGHISRRALDGRVDGCPQSMALGFVVGELGIRQLPLPPDQCADEAMGGSIVPLQLLPLKHLQPCTGCISLSCLSAELSASGDKQTK